MAKLERKKEVTIQALLTLNTVEEVANQVGVSSRTIHKWLRDKDFQIAYRAVKRQIVDQSISNITAISGLAVEQLHDLLINSNSDHVKLSASKLILDYSLQKVDIEEILSKLEELEERTGAK